jgi:hypothetical protein
MAKRDRAQTGARRIAWFRQMLGTFPVGTLIDLGSGHGKFAQVAADLGWKVTAQDGRGDRFPTDDRITWEVGDVRDVDVTGFDVIACLGLWYHLTLDDQLGLLAKTRGTPMILDTHVANDRGSMYPLSEVVTQHGYEGRLYHEPDQAIHSTASLGNDESFWPRPKALYQMLGDHGYDVMTAMPFYWRTRTFFLCLPRD